MYGNWINAIPSRFVDELPEEHVEVEAETGLTVRRVDLIFYGEETECAAKEIS